MKPLAILRDSLREAWDSKLLLVMLILSSIFLIGVASVGYQPGAAQPVFDSIGGTLNSHIARVNKGQLEFPMREHLATFSISDVKVTNESATPSASSYEFTLRIFSYGKAEEVPPEVAGKGPRPKADGPNKDPRRDGFDRLVAAWHEDGSGKLVKVENTDAIHGGTIGPALAPVTDVMAMDFVQGLLERTDMQVLEVKKLPNMADVNEQLYRVSTGPWKEPRTWPVAFSIGFGAWKSETAVVPLGLILSIIQDTIINSAAGMGIIMLGVIVTSFFIPNMLRKGAIDLMLAKPLSRVTLLLFKFLGGTFFVLILASFLIGGVWLITGLRAGVWSTNFLLVIPLMTFAFAMLYALSTLVAVWTRSSITCILVTLAFGGVLWLVGKVYIFADLDRQSTERKAEFLKETPKIATWVVVTEGLKNALPRWRDIDVISSKVVNESVMTPQQIKQLEGPFKKTPPSWMGTFGVTAAWMFGFLGLACWRFSSKDY